ncbi:hypothetical protein [Eubacterium sp.]|uniref:hypothetical protein n=1 Tax=Eubacterium sp. TaxID=142586 RepID=UPI0039998F40
MRKGLFTKKIVAYVCAATMVFSSFAGVSVVNNTNVIADETKADIVLNDTGSPLIKTWGSADGEGYAYEGYVYCGDVSSDYKYLQITYSGAATALKEARWELLGKDDKALGTYWFSQNDQGTFKTTDDTLVPAPTETAQTVVIDLEKTGVDLSASGVNAFHFHNTKGNGTLSITDARFMTSLPAEDTKADIVLNDTGSPLIKTWGSADGEGYAYEGYVYCGDVSSDYKYLQITYSGAATALKEARWELLGKDDKALGTYWFSQNDQGTFKTTDDTLVPAPTETAQTVVIDLEKTGVDLSASGINAFHFHNTKGNGALTITDARFITKVPEEVTTPAPTEAPTEGPTEAPTTPQPTTAADPSTGIKLDDVASGMNKTLHIDKAASGATDGIKYAYLGFVTFKDLATKDFRYLKLTYTGDITSLRFEFNEKATNANQGPFWFDAEQDVHFVTADGSPIQLVGNNTTVVIDLVASGVDMSKYNNGIHMHGNSTTDAAFDVTIKDAVLYGGVPTPQPTTVAPTKKPTVKVSKPGTASVKKATKKKASAKVKISLKKVKKAKGYYVQISTSKKFKKVLVKKYVKKVSFTLKSKKIKNKKKLYVRAKAYKLNGKKKVLSKKWSKVKKVKITK